ncbi:hypothetical protein [Methylorubrum rhodinum]|uniref:hypothetical protein n=1 Tax=Methylorubrum rhodinum TaxID=29428 RepID=UPI00161C52F0|nr:hypothetical protein [Methylorubrum rhodinum]
MHGVRTAFGIAAVLGGLAGGLLAASSAEAGCTRQIINRSGYTALVSRDGGPWVAVRPHRAQAIRYAHSGRIDVALTCGRGALPESAAFRASFGTVAVIDRCYIQFGDGFFEEQLGGGFWGRKDTGPLALNNPRQGDLVVGPAAGACAPERGALSARY